MDQEVRITKLEIQADYHEREIAELKNSGRTLSVNLAKIEYTLNQIKWIVIGGVTVLVGYQIGVIPALKLLVSGG